MSRRGTQARGISFALNPTSYRFSLKKEYRQRPKYAELLKKPFITKYLNEEVDVAAFVNAVLDASAAARQELVFATGAATTSPQLNRQSDMQRSDQSVASPTPPPSSSDEAPLTGSPSKEARLPQTIMGAGTASNSSSPTAEEGGLAQEVDAGVAV